MGASFTHSKGEAMKIKFMFHGYVLTGYFIRRIEDKRFLVYVPKRFRVLGNIRNDDFLNLDEYHLAIPDRATGVPRNPKYREFMEKYPIQPFFEKCDGCENDCTSENDCIFCPVCNREHNADNAGNCTACGEVGIIEV